MFKFGSYKLDPLTTQLTKDEQTLKVEPQVFNTLLLLVKNNHRVVTKDELLKEIWHGRPVTDQVITRTIYELRKVLDDKIETPHSHIRTVRGQGYQFVASVNDSLPTQKQLGKSTQKVQGHSKIWQRIALLAVVIIALIITTMWAIDLSQSSKPTPKQNPPLPIVKKPVVAVLPIDVQTGNEELSIMVQSLIDYLTNQLALNLNMRVIHPDSLLTTDNQPDDIGAIQQLTQSDFIIKGYIESATDQNFNLHLTLYKTNGKDDLTPFPLGAFEFPYPQNSTELNSLYKQRKITIKSIVQIIQPSMTFNDDGDFETADPEAYRLVIAAHHMLRTDNCKEMARAEQLLLKAVARDETFVYAYLQLFTNYYKRVWICGESTDYHQKGLEMAEIIDRLAPNTYHSLATRRSTILVESNQVEQAFEFSKNADWNNPDAIYDKCYSLRYAGFLRACSKHIDRILQLNPFFFNEKPIEQSPSTLLYQNRFTEHLALLAEPGNSYHDYFRGLNLFFTDDSNQALRILTEVINRTPTDLFGKFSGALKHIIMGDNTAAITQIDAIAILRQKKKHTDGEMTYKLAQLYALAKAPNLALKKLQLAVDQGFFPMNYFLIDPAMASIKTNEKFKSIIGQATQRHQAFAQRFGLESETNPEQL